MAGLSQGSTAKAMEAVGQHANRYRAWFKNHQPYEVPYTVGYAPSVMMRMPVPVLYDESFVAVGSKDGHKQDTHRHRVLDQGTTLDVASHRYELAAAGFGFVVHPSAFTVYAPQADNIAAPLDVKSFEAGWACWRPFVDRVQVQYRYFASEPCWVSKEVWPVVNSVHNDKCVSVHQQTAEAEKAAA